MLYKNCCDNKSKRTNPIVFFLFCFFFERFVCSVICGYGAIFWSFQVISSYSGALGKYPNRVWMPIFATASSDFLSEL